MLVMIAILMLVAAMPLWAVDYHIDALAGDDDADGTTPARPWRTLARASAAMLAPGDRVLLSAGAPHAGTLELRSGGTAELPITVGVYAGERAAIVVSDPSANAVRITNAGGIIIERLDLRGPGHELSRGAGVRLVACDERMARFTHLRLRDLDASGFHDGLLIDAVAHGEIAFGFADVRIERCRAHGNGMAGIRSGGIIESLPGYLGWPHADVQVLDCQAWSNPGITTKTDNHSGNGILIGCVDGPLIERCQAWDNGGNCNAGTGGPVGIWLWECTHGRIAHCVSHHNRVGTCRKDGGGFDFDGGVTDSLMEHNISYANAGAGYLVCQYRGARPLLRNVIRGNLSVADGQHTDNIAGIHVCNWDVPGALADLEITNNTLIASPGDQPTVAILGDGHASSDRVRVVGNLLVAHPGCAHVTWECAGELTMAGNAYAGDDGLRASLRAGTAADLAAWSTLAGETGGWQGTVRQVWSAGLPAADAPPLTFDPDGVLPFAPWPHGGPAVDLVGRSAPAGSMAVPGACQPGW